MADRFPSLEPGDPRVLGPYELVGVLGAGGMGKVYLGRAQPAAPGGIPTPVAVKVLLPHLAHDDGLIRRFAREAHAARAVRSHRVARVIASDPAPSGGNDEQSIFVRESGDQPPWIATEFLAGPTLSHAIRVHGPFTEPQLRALGADLAAALEDIAAAGLIHRDLKPANVVLTERGPCVIDFGIARPEHGLTLTTTGSVPATPGYAPPEQLLGHRVGPAADVFSLGSVLTRAATKRSPFAADDPLQTNYRVVYEEPRLDGVPDALRDLIARCLSKDPAARPDAAEVRQTLAAPRSWRARLFAGDRRRGDHPEVDPFWQGGRVAEEITESGRQVRGAMGGPPSAETPVRGGPSRRRMIALAAGGGALALTVGGTLLLRRGTDAPSEPDDLTGLTTDAEPLTDFLPGVAPDPLWEQTGAVDEAHHGRPAVPAASVVVVAAPGGGVVAHRVDGSGEALWHERRADAARGIVAAGGTPAERGELLLVATAEGELLACRAADGEEVWNSADVTVAELLAADETLVYVRNDAGQVHAVDLRNGATRWTVDDSPETSGTRDDLLRPAAVAGAGRLLLCSAGSVRALDTDDGAEVWSRPVTFPLGPLPPAIDVAEGLVALGGAELLLLSLDDGAEQWNQSGRGGDGFGAPAFGEGVVCVTERFQLSCRNIEDGAPRWSARLSIEDALPPTEPPVVEGNRTRLPSSATPVRRSGRRPLWA